ncbi:MAG: DUF63 family protein, partial [Thermoplasmatota archaeon]
MADSKDTTVNGVSAGYNTVNTIVYGICIVISFFGIYELIDYFEIKIDNKFLTSLLPWIALGGALRSLEDVGLFRGPLNRFFISPIIYFVLGISAIISMVVGAHINRQDYDKKFTTVIRLVLIIPLLISLGIMTQYFNEIILYPFILLVSVFILVTLYGYFRDWIDETYLFALYGSSLLFFSFGYNYHYITSLEGTNPFEALMIPSLSVGVTVLFLGFWKLVGMIGNEEIFRIYFTPLNILIAWAHFFDASATYRGIEHYGYLEKHVLPRFAI